VGSAELATGSTTWGIPAALLRKLAGAPDVPFCATGSIAMAVVPARCSVRNGVREGPDRCRCHRRPRRGSLGADHFVLGHAADRSRLLEQALWHACKPIVSREAPTGVLGSARLQSVRKQYHFWPGDDGLDAWDVDRLIELSRDLPIERVAVESIAEIDTSYWFEGSAAVATVRKVVEHTKLILEVDLSYPVILGRDGRVMDGMHRIARALVEGRAEIVAVRFPVPLEPDYRNCRPHELPY
jgi:hypothetical protein